MDVVDDPSSSSRRRKGRADHVSNLILRATVGEAECSQDLLAAERSPDPPATECSPESPSVANDVEAVLRRPSKPRRPPRKASGDVQLQDAEQEAGESPSSAHGGEEVLRRLSKLRRPPRNAFDDVHLQDAEQEVAESPAAAHGGEDVLSRHSKPRRKASDDVQVQGVEQEVATASLAAHGGEKVFRCHSQPRRPQRKNSDIHLQDTEQEVEEVFSMPVAPDEETPVRRRSRRRSSSRKVTRVSLNMLLKDTDDVTVSGHELASGQEMPAATVEQSQPFAAARRPKASSGERLSLLHEAPKAPGEQRERVASSVAVPKTTIAERPVTARAQLASPDATPKAVGSERVAARQATHKASSEERSVSLQGTHSTPSAEQSTSPQASGKVIGGDQFSSSRALSKMPSGEQRQTEPPPKAPGSDRRFASAAKAPGKPKTFGGERVASSQAAPTAPNSLQVASLQATATAPSDEQIALPQLAPKTVGGDRPQSSQSLPKTPSEAITSPGSERPQFSPTARTAGGERISSRMPLTDGSERLMPNKRPMPVSVPKRSTAALAVTTSPAVMPGSGSVEASHISAGGSSQRNTSKSFRGSLRANLLASGRYKLREMLPRDPEGKVHFKHAAIGVLKTLRRELGGKDAEFDFLHSCIVSDAPQTRKEFDLADISEECRSELARKRGNEVTNLDPDGFDNAHYDPKVLIGEIKAKTMHKMVHHISTDRGVKKVLYLPNEHCKFLSGDRDLAPKIEEHFEIDTPQLVIKLLLSNGDTAWVEDSKLAYPKNQPLVVTGVLEIEPGKSYFSFDMTTVAACLHVYKPKGKTFKVRKSDGKVGTIKVFENQEDGYYARWDPIQEAGPKDWLEGDTVELMANQKDTPLGNYSWPSRRESMQADQRLVTFMQEVIIPLAAETNAIVLCQAHVPDCMLSSAFSKAMEMKKHIWPGKPPFTVIGMTDAMWLYTGSKTKYWRQFQKVIPSWESMEPRYKKHFPEDVPTDRSCDLDKGIDNFIINDRMERNEQDGMSNKPFLKFQNELIRQWLSRVPAFSISTGFSFNFNRVLSPLQGGSPVVFVDGRERTAPKSLEEAFNAHKEFRNLLIDKRQTCDYLTNETLAYFHSALQAQHAANVASDVLDASTRLPLHAAITKRAKENQSAVNEEICAKKTADIEMIARYIINANFDDQFKVLPDRKRREADGEEPESFQLDMRLDKIRELVVGLGHQKMHSCSCSSLPEAKKLINSLTRVNRVPDHESLDGLRLLQEAWDHYDVKMYLADWYKGFAKTLYAILLFLGVLSIALTILDANVEGPERSSQRSRLCETYRNRTTRATRDAAPAVVASICEAASVSTSDPNAWLSLTVLLVSVLATIGVSVEGYVRAANRWRTLRTAALSLESLIWLYRTRVGPFAETSTTEPQVILCKKLTEWSNNISVGSELSSTSLEQNYNAEVYKHHQYTGGENLGLNADDFHSPMSSQRYIDCRLIPRREFYEKRVPKYVRYRMLFQIATFLCSALSAVLSYAGSLSWVGIVSAVAAAITSWVGFTDLSRKSERYTNAITGIKDLERKWATLTPVQQSDRRNMMELVTQGEMVLNSEYSTWSSSIAKSDEKDKKEDKKHKSEEAASELVQNKRK